MTYYAGSMFSPAIHSLSLRFGGKLRRTSVGRVSRHQVAKYCKHEYRHLLGYSAV
jgi:hypothetical protein